MYLVNCRRQHVNTYLLINYTAYIHRVYYWNVEITSVDVLITYDIGEIFYFVGNNIIL